ncbi:membrane-bound mannosyltransferase [Halogeometricum pallidum JCM 14848]|uniref:Membrane-bound mannosyltransferase n=1 Tax=Halogeometricum pallidum JCM 14848 TaxID=1227487 RepID=M0CT93_HALPD|nr:flippase activity-associated protein Agl23 [Halogeometricum pallidum]ELZ26431.1 membrane-bound mannosyltransferase [Halogeometricum pallidum JCM 14848]
MSLGDAPDDAAGRRRGVRLDGVAAAVAVLAALGLLARLVDLGARPFHWDEARVGYWSLRYLEVGSFEYRPVAGGPLLYHLDRLVFALVGATDATARLPVAVLGAALPLCALLFRDRLDDADTLLFAALLGFSPLFVYYSRFLRGDVPLALFALAFVGFAVRAYDRRSRRDAYLGSVALALAFASSGFVAAYVLCWLAAAVLLLDQPSAVVDAGSSTRRQLAALRSRVASRTGAAARAFLLFLGTTVLCFAPRAGPHVDVGLWKPTTWHLVLYESTVGALWSFLGVRVLNRWPYSTHSLFPYVEAFADTLVVAALPVLVAAVAALLWNRYAGAARRPLLDGFAYWSAAAFALLPVVTEVSAPWVAVHVLLPASLLAAVGGAALARRAVALGRGADRDAASVAAVCLVLLAVLAQTGAVTAAGVYGPSDRSNDLAQFAQPSDDLTPLAENATAVADGDPSTPEVLYVGEEYYTAWDPGNEYPPTVDSWGNRLPLPWYFERAGADEVSTENATTLAQRESVPPIVVTEPELANAVGDTLGGGYERSTYRLGLWDRETVVFVRR